MTEERREAPRVPVEKDVDAAVSGARVRLLELSASGARIEHTERFPLKGAQLSMSWNLREIELPIRVARSEIAGRSGDALLYHSGIYFVHTTPESDAFIASIIGQEAMPAPPPEAPRSAANVPTEPIRAMSGDVPPHAENSPAAAAAEIHVRRIQPEATTVRKIERHHDAAATAVAPPPLSAPQALVAPPVELPPLFEPPAPSPAPRMAAPQPAPAAAPERPAPEPMPSSSFDDSWIREVNFLRDDPEDQLPYAQFRLTPTGWEKSYVATPDQPEDGFTVERGQKDFTEIQRTFEWADEDTRRMLRAALKARMGQA